MAKRSFERAQGKPPGKLPFDVIQEIRLLREEENAPIKWLATEYGTTESTIKNVCEYVTRVHA